MSCENCANAYDEGYTAGHNAENARLREAIGLATTAVPTMEMDAADPVGMMQRVVAEVTRLRAQADALADALEGLVEEVWPSEMIAEGIEPEEGVSVAGPVDGGTVADARAALRAYREPGSPAIHTKYLDDQLVERCITCLERWPCKEATQSRLREKAIVLGVAEWALTRDERNDVETIQGARGWRECPEHNGFWLSPQDNHTCVHPLPNPLTDTPEGAWEFVQILKWAEAKGRALAVGWMGNGYGDFRAAIIAALATAVRNESEVEG